ncbi:ABC transporter substrate-binding protein [Qipengyuania sp. DGS5-3]|uniref:ABC transporter substrate-binding protein n=1 Tax=Qipengyuania sp. DGS5-3 TaxID=3349632 RepID=UPI0036D2B07E
MRSLFLFASLTLLSACALRDDDGAIDVAIIGENEELFSGGLRLSYGAQHVRAATSQGLVRLETGGEVVPAIAERWIVTDDGASYIFRIREFDLPDGTRLTAQSVRDSLRRSISRLGGTSMGYDLAKIRDVRALTGRVIEIRLKSPMPGFLQLLAQPELSLQIDAVPTGPMSMAREDDVGLLNALPPEARGLPARPNWDEDIQQVRVSAADAQTASDGFNDGRFDLVLGGRIENLPIAETGALTRGTVRLDSTIGSFGLDILNTEGFLALPQNREALAMGIDREALIQPFNIAGWVSTTRLVSPGLPDESELLGERWTNLTDEERIQTARARVSQWQTANDEPVRLRLFLPEGAGSDILFEGLAGQLEQIGVQLVRSEDVEGADLALRDRVARYGGARWFLNQFNCEVSRAICSEDVDFLVQLAVDSSNPEEARSYLIEAETALTVFNPYIPLGAPIRWSLVRGDIEDFVENPWNVHPLFPLSRAPI